MRNMWEGMGGEASAPSLDFARALHLPGLAGTRPKEDNSRKFYPVRTRHVYVKRKTKSRFKMKVNGNSEVTGYIRTGAGLNTSTQQETKKKTPKNKKKRVTIKLVVTSHIQQPEQQQCPGLPCPASACQRLPAGVRGFDWQSCGGGRRNTWARNNLALEMRGASERLGPKKNYCLTSERRVGGKNECVKGSECEKEGRGLGDSLMAHTTSE